MTGVLLERRPAIIEASHFLKEVCRLLSLQQPGNHLDRMREVLCLSTLSGQGAILFGPPGYGKSSTLADFKGREVCSGFLSFFRLRCLPFVGSEDADPTAFFGGIDMKTLREVGSIKYNLTSKEKGTLSLQTADVLLLEELFQFPPQVLKQLKDVLERRAIVNGSQVESISTLVQVACTNVEPSEVEDSDDFWAFVQRFPLLLKVAPTPEEQIEERTQALVGAMLGDNTTHFEEGRKELLSQCGGRWPSRTTLLAWRKQVKETPFSPRIKGFLPTLALQLMKAYPDRFTDRSVGHLISLMRASAVLRQANEVGIEDLRVARYLFAEPGKVAKIEKSIALSEREEHYSNSISYLIRKWDDIEDKGSLETLIKSLRRFKALKQEVSETCPKGSCPESLKDDLDSLYRTIDQSIKRVQSHIYRVA